MMPSKKSSLADRIEQEHKHLKRNMGDIEIEVMKKVSDSDYPNWRLEFMWRVRDFRNHLLKHFDLEEEGGFMGELLEKAPERMRQVKKLKDEHGDMLAQIDVILSELKRMESNPMKVADVRERVKTLLAAIKDHEAMERELIQRAYYREYGYPGAS